MEELVKQIMAYNEVPLHLRETVCEEMHHGVEVSNLAGLIAGEMGLPEKICNQLEVAGILHDIGKLKLTKYLYSEDGLIVEQMKYVRQHTAQSYEIIRSSNIDEEIARAVYYHHENYDGSGYPDNLRGEDIPIMARILRVCDVFIALTTDRSYRRAFDPHSALEIMIDEVSDYDMQVFLAFQRVMHNKVFKEGMIILRKPYKERQREALRVFLQEMQYLG